MGALTSDQPPRTGDDTGPVLYRDGRPVVDRPAREQLDILLNHTDPSHPDHNPNDKTAHATVPAVKEMSAILQNLSRGQSAGGRKRAQQKIAQGEQSAIKIAETERRLRRDGKTRNLNKLIARETGLSTRTVRKHRDKLRKKSGL